MKAEEEWRALPKLLQTYFATLHDQDKKEQASVLQWRGLEDYGSGGSNHPPSTHRMSGPRSSLPTVRAGRECPGPWHGCA